MRLSDLKIHILLLSSIVLGGCTICDYPVETREITARTFRVLRVIDGDTFVVRYDGENTSVRLYGYNAPELREAGGLEAAEALRKLIDDKDVRLVFCARKRRDNFGRLLARVYLDNVDIIKKLY